MGSPPFQSLKHFLQTKPEGGWNFVLKLSNQDLTETQKRIIDSYNLLGDCSRRKMDEKEAYYFLMMDIKSLFYPRPTMKQL